LLGSVIGGSIRTLCDVVYAIQCSVSDFPRNWAVGNVGRFRRGGRPFDFAAGVPQPGRYPPDNLDIAGAIEAIRFAPVEVGYGFDAAGRQIFRHVGDENLIFGIGERDLAAIVDGMFIQNHPPYFAYIEGDPRRRAGSFSSTDLVFMYEHNLVELIAVTRERTYFLGRRGEGFFLDSGQIRSDYGEALIQVETRLRRLAEGGIISSEEAAGAGRIADEVMERLSVAFRYRREEVGRDAL
jgi:hypothetical protein